MHPYDLLYRGVNLTEPSNDNEALVRSLITAVVAAVTVAAVISWACPGMTDTWDTIIGIGILAAVLPATFALTAHATNRARKIRTTDTVELTLLDANVEANVDNVAVDSVRCTYTVRRNGTVWRRRERSSDTPFTVNVAIDDTQHDAIIDWLVTNPDSRDVTATLTYQPAEPGRIDDIVRLPIGTIDTFTVTHDTRELTWRPPAEQ